MGPPRNFTRKMLLTVSLLVPCFAASCDEWDVDRSGHVLGYRVTIEPNLPEAQAMLLIPPMFIHDHPLFPFLAERVPEPLKTSDVASRAQFARTEVSNEVYCHGGVNYQMICFPPGQESSHLCVTVNRPIRDFTERDRLMLSLLWPHLLQARNNALALAKATGLPNPSPNDLAEHAWEVAQLDRDGRPQWFSERAAEWLKRYFVDATSAWPWPETLARWVRRQQWPAKWQESALEPRRPLVMKRAAGELTVTFAPGRDGTGMLLLNVTGRAAPPEGKFASLPLTVREREVFGWICEGKSNPEIAAILGISVHTVHHHVEHLFAKLDVENRLQAQRLGWELRTRA